MSKSLKIKSLLALKGVKSAELSKALGLARQQALTTKYSRESFTSDDLIVIGEITNTRLAFVDENNNPVIIFDKQDIKS